MSGAWTITDIATDAHIHKGVVGALVRVHDIEVVQIGPCKVVTETGLQVLTPILQKLRPNWTPHWERRPA